MCFVSIGIIAIAGREETFNQLHRIQQTSTIHFEGEHEIITFGSTHQLSFIFRLTFLVWAEDMRHLSFGWYVHNR